MRVTPIEEEVEFQFRIEAELVGANLVGDDAASVTLRVLSPLPGGGLGAEAVVLDISPETTHPHSRTGTLR